MQQVISGCRQTLTPESRQLYLRKIATLAGTAEKRPAERSGWHSHRDRLKIKVAFQGRFRDRSALQEQMEQRNLKWSKAAPTAQIEQLLANRYGQLLKWGAHLTRGDEGKAQDIVQEFCLYFSLTKPDLSDVVNLDGYLYTCLRHIYLSSLARSSREAQHFVSVAEFDSFEFAVAGNRSGDPLQRQNDLRRICSYAVWRKEVSKTASYFILHFFHGYARQEIAELARLPIAAIYNKLKIARTEVKLHLQDSTRLRVVKIGSPPEPRLSWSLLPSAELFRELRATIANGKTSDCLPEEELLAFYRSSALTPISCSLLAHIVSCEQCLAVIDRHFRRPTLQDREPLDALGFSAQEDNEATSRTPKIGQQAILRSLRRYWSGVHGHRPEILSIAVDGKIIACHDVRAERSTLSARIEYPERVQFVEVFTEQDVRLALLSISDLPPAGPQARSQRLELSDSRCLELKLVFDGRGLDSQVAYFDPALRAEVIEDNEDLTLATASQTNDSMAVPHGRLVPSDSRITSVFRRLLRTLTLSSAIAWAFASSLIVGFASYLVYRHVNQPTDAISILSQSVKIEATSLLGQTEHQVLHLEEVSADGRVLQQASVDLWRDGDGRRYMRRLYDPHHRLIAAEWRNQNNEHSFRPKKHGADTHHSLLMSILWKEDLSAQAFKRLGGSNYQIHSVADGYELTVIGPVPDRPELITATLVLDRHLLPLREVMRVRVGSEAHELRFVQAEYVRRPSSSVSDTIFSPDSELGGTQSLHSSVRKDNLPSPIGTKLQLAQLQIAVLHQLNLLNADTREPIEVVRTQDEHIRVSGSVLDSSLRQEILSRLEKLGDHHLLDVQLTVPGEIHLPVSASLRPNPTPVSVYELEQGRPEIDAILRRHFEANGHAGERLDAVMKQYSNDVLQHSQRALQHAYALNRLGNALSSIDVKSIGLASRQEWTEMVEKHAKDLETELSGLKAQLSNVDASGTGLPDTTGQAVRIEDPTQFDRATHRLLHQTEDLNNKVGKLFTSNPSEEERPAKDTLITIINAIPLQQSKEIMRFASALNSSGTIALKNRSSNGDEKTFDQTR